MSLRIIYRSSWKVGNHNASFDAVQIGRNVEDFIFMLDYR
ncbi:hypothetical protein GRPL_01074 [Raoultella planticola ATCC 33531]|nr:hypothetical protein GRPL_01074 [Raoultella planticola ATCC 33531]